MAKLEKHAVEQDSPVLRLSFMVIRHGLQAERAVIDGRTIRRHAVHEEEMRESRGKLRITLTLLIYHDQCIPSFNFLL